MSFSYARLYPTRGDQLFDASLAYIISVVLIGLSGVVFGIAVLIVGCGYNCAQCRCCKRCCKNRTKKKSRALESATLSETASTSVQLDAAISFDASSKESSQEQLLQSKSCCARTKRRWLRFCALRSLTRRQERIAQAVVITLLALASVGFIVGIVGSQLVSQGLQPVMELLLTVNRLVGILLQIFLAALAISSRLADVFFEFATKTDIGISLNITNATAVNTFRTIDRLVRDLRETLCGIPTYVLAANIVSRSIVMLGFCVCLASAVLIVVAMLLKSRSLVIVGFYLVVTGLTIAGIAFAVASPVSVLIDDVCYTASVFLNSLYGSLILECVNAEAFNFPVALLVNVTSFFGNTVINRNALAFNNVTQQNFFRAPVNQPFYHLATNAETCMSAANVSIPPFLDMLIQGQQAFYANTSVQLWRPNCTWTNVQLQFVNITNALAFFQQCFSNFPAPVIEDGFPVAWLRISIDTAAMFVLEGLFIGLAWIGNCPLWWRDFLLALLKNICIETRDGIAMIVWGLFASCFLFVSAVAFFVFLRWRPAPKVPMRPALALVLVCLAQSFALSLTAIILFEADGYGYVGYVVFCCASGIVFIALAIPPHRYGRRWIRLVAWISTLVVCTAFLAYYTFLFVNLVIVVVRCFGAPSVPCTLACSVLEATGSLILCGLVGAMIALLLSAFVAIVLVLFYKPCFERVLTEDDIKRGILEEEFDYYAVSLDRL